MEIVKVVLVVAAALGSTWVAREVTATLGGPARGAALVQAAEPAPPGGAAGATGAGAAPAGGAQEPPSDGVQAGDARLPPAVPGMSREEMEEELRRAQAEIAGGRGEGGLDEFRPSRPLPADLPIALPSDI
jgi:hypothetical protein